MTNFDYNVYVVGSIPFQVAIFACMCCKEAYYSFMGHLSATTSFLWGWIVTMKRQYLLSKTIPQINNNTSLQPLGLYTMH